MSIEPECSRAGIARSLDEARAPLQQREEAQTLRERSQSIFEQRESLTREAMRPLDSAEQAYGEDFAAGSAANKEAIVKVREMAATLRSRMEKNKSAYEDTLIVDTRLVSQEVGVQVTLDLDNSRLDLAALLRRLPGAELTPIAEDRLQVAWSSAGIGINQIVGSRPASRDIAA